jgi:hypothetical protein
MNYYEQLQGASFSLVYMNIFYFHIDNDAVEPLWLLQLYWPAEPASTAKTVGFARKNSKKPNFILPKRKPDFLVAHPVTFCQNFLIGFSREMTIQIFKVVYGKLA